MKISRRMAFLAICAVLTVGSAVSSSASEIPGVVLPDFFGRSVKSDCLTAQTPLG
jgi:hypothetical protein